MLMQLARWNYTREEWKNFLRWKTRKKGLLFFLFQKLMPLRSQRVPEIKITDDTVWVNNAQRSFQNEQCQVRNIHIREEGKINILRINYEQANKTREINIPIPKGKLREAFEVQD